MRSDFEVIHASVGERELGADLALIADLEWELFSGSIGAVGTARYDAVAAGLAVVGAVVVLGSDRHEVGVGVLSCLDQARVVFSLLKFELVVVRVYYFNSNWNPLNH